MVLAHQSLPTRHFGVRGQSYCHLSERKGCVRGYGCHGLNISPWPPKVPLSSNALIMLVTRTMPKPCIGGKTGFHAAVRDLSAFGIAWIALVDGDSLKTESIWIYETLRPAERFAGCMWDCHTHRLLQRQRKSPRSRRAFLPSGSTAE